MSAADVRYTAVHPYVWPPYRDAMLATCKLDLFEVDNTSDNRGYPPSINLGIDRMKADGSDWLIIISSSLRFGQPGGLDFIDRLGNYEGKVLEGAVVFGWHLIAFHRQVIEDVGYWDTNFSPYGFDDLDYSLRFQLTYGDASDVPLWDKVHVDVTDELMAHSIKLAKIDLPDVETGREYYRRKWGIWPGESTVDNDWYRTPFDDPTMTVRDFPGAP